MSGSAEPPSSTETALEYTTAPTITEFPVPQRIQDMLLAAAPEALPMKYLIACSDKFIKFDNNQSEHWQHMVSTLEWLKKESGQVPQASDAQFLAQLVHKAKKGHYVFREDSTLIAGDITSVYYKMHPNFLEKSDRTKADAEFVVHVKPILKAVAKFMHNTYNGKRATCMSQTFDTTQLIQDCYENCWKQQEKPNWGWTPEKMHRAFNYDKDTFESDLEAGTVRFKDWSNLVNYHLNNDFDVKKKPGEWDVSAKNNGKGENKGSNNHAAENSWELPPTKLSKGMSKGNTKNDDSSESYNNPYSWYGVPRPNNQPMQQWEASSSSTGLPNMNQGAGGNGKGQYDKAPWKQQDKAEDRQQKWY
jgi:hypothetical protein